MLSKALPGNGEGFFLWLLTHGLIKIILPPFILPIHHWPGHLESKLEFSPIGFS